MAPKTRQDEFLDMLWNIFVIPDTWANLVADTWIVPMNQVLCDLPIGKDRGPETPGGSRVRVPMGRGRGMDISTPGPPGGTLNVRVEFHFFPAHWGIGHGQPGYGYQVV